MSSGDQIVDPMQDRVNATMRLARLVAGDDEARYVQAFHTIYNAADQPTIQGDGPQEAAGGGRAEGAPTRTRSVPGASPGIPVDSVFSDPVYLANAQWLMKTRVRVVGGVPTTGFEDCVAVGSATAWCCTATLVAPDVAITAGHCTRGGCGDRVFVGRDVDQSAEGQTYTVRDRQANPGYRPPRAQDDISVLLLDRPVEGVAPRAIASPSSLRRARSVRVVGYGYTDTDGSTGYGIRRLVDVPLATADPRFGGTRRPSSSRVPHSSIATVATATVAARPTSRPEDGGSSPARRPGRPKARFGNAGTAGSTRWSQRTTTGSHRSCTRPFGGGARGRRRAARSRRDESAPPVSTTNAMPSAGRSRSRAAVATAPGVRVRPVLGRGDTNVITLQIPYEPLKPGPVGRSVAVIDPASSRSTSRAPTWPRGAASSPRSRVRSSTSR